MRFEGIFFAFYALCLILYFTLLTLSTFRTFEKGTISDNS